MFFLPSSFGGFTVRVRASGLGFRGLGLRAQGSGLRAYAGA